MLGVGRQGRAGPERARFIAMDLLVDPRGEPLAAWQVQVRLAPGVSIVGIEGGGGPGEARPVRPPDGGAIGQWQPMAGPGPVGPAPFAEPPVYDPRAIENDRVILAAYSLAGAERLPTVRSRVARLHLRVPAGMDDAAAAAHELRVIAAGNVRAERIGVAAELVRADGAR
jgi:hypothetical protein